MRTVRIKRKGNGIARRNFAFAGVMITILQMFAKYAGGTYRDALESAKLEKVQVETQVSDLRKAKLSNDLVIQDLKIEALKRELGITSAGDGFAPKDY